MLNIAQQFAAYLDQRKFDEAMELLAEDCQYHYWEGTYAGRENVIGLYRQEASFSDSHFDEVAYGSEVEPLQDQTFKLHLFTEYRIGEQRHESRSEEILHFECERIVHIEHRELPGEAEAFMQFYRNVRPGPGTDRL